MSTLLVDRENGELRAAVIMRGKLYAYAREGASAAIHEEQLYLGVVERAAKGLNAVFVRLSSSESGFLPFPSGQRLPASGERLLVQVKRPPTPGKKALLSRDIALSGGRLVFLPSSHGLKLSLKIEDKNARARLLAVGNELTWTRGGVILRSAALDCPREDLQQELDALSARWLSIEERARLQNAPALLWDGENRIAAFIRDEEARLEAVLTNAPDALPDTLSVPVRLCERPFAIHNVEHQFANALRRTVRLSCGGTLVFDICEAMTVIDVNSAQAIGKNGLAQTAEAVNTEAAWEIARLLRLRRIGGMILVDFIDLEAQEAQERLLSVMREALREDPVKATAHDVTRLGLMEITRRRIAPPLAAPPDTLCPACGGSGVCVPPIEE